MSGWPEDLYRGIPVNQGNIPARDERDSRAIYDLIDDPYLKERVRRICQQRDDAINAMSAARAAISRALPGGEGK